MPTTLNPTCPLCGLRFTFGPLLELHLRDDHRHRASEQEHEDLGDARGDRAAGER